MAELPEEASRRVCYRRWLSGAFAFIALLVVARFVLEVCGASHSATRFLSSSGAVFLVAIYLGAVAPLRGIRKSLQLIIPGILLVVWTQAWVILFTVVSGALRLERSHFAEPEDWGNWSHVGRHVLGHLAEIVPISLIVLIFMAATLVLWRWPVTVGPGALLGALVVIRFSAEAMGVAPSAASAWSSSVAFLLCGFYLGGIGPRWGLVSARRLFAPALVLGWTWRFWIFVAALMSAAAPYYRTHFFDTSGGRVIPRLVGFLGIEVVLVGFIAGLILWGIAFWTMRVSRSMVSGAFAAGSGAAE